MSDGIDINSYFAEVDLSAYANRLTPSDPSDLAPFTQGCEFNDPTACIEIDVVPLAYAQRLEARVRQLEAELNQPKHLRWQAPINRETT